MGGWRCFGNASPSPAPALVCLSITLSGLWVQHSRPPPQPTPHPLLPQSSNPPPTNPPLLTGLSSNAPQDSVKPCLSSKSNLGARYKYVMENKGGDRLIMFKKKTKKKTDTHHLVVFVACCWAWNSRKIKRNNGRDPLTNSQVYFFSFSFFAVVLQKSPACD